MAKTKYIETPEKMWELFEAYRTKVKANPIKVNEFVGKDAIEVNRKKERPLTMEGFECHVFDQGLNGELSHYFSNHEKRYVEYIAVCSRIRKYIRADQIEGGMAEIYNPSITQRLNGLKEQVEQTNMEQPLFPKADESKTD